MTPRTSPARPLARAALTALFLFLPACSSDPLSEPGSSADAGEVDVTLRHVALIEPGTVIGEKAPRGWSNLVLKSHPRVAPESKDKVSASTAKYAGFLFTAILADVQPTQPAGGGYLLSNFAVGVGTRLNGLQDVILSSDTQERLGAKLGFLEKQILSGGEKQLGQMRCVARSRSMAILDTPSVMVVGGKHQKVTLRYMLLVDPRSGRLDTLLWALEDIERAEESEPLTPVQWLAPDKIVDCQLHADPKEFTFGIPSSLAFAMIEVPQGQKVLQFPRQLRTTAAALKFTPEAAAALEAGLRRLMVNPK